ncbi:MAG TPA: hypothetical protein VGC87_12375 [Pyrinomonadaceae bacterium]|jgi:hypothetical protein
MRATKITTFSTLGIASLVLLVSACGKASNTTANMTTNTSTVNTTSKSNTAAVASPTPTAASNTANVSNKAQEPAGQSEAEDVDGELQVGKTQSVILYVGMESGDYAGYCFTNDSEAGRAILAACKDKEQCQVKGTVDHEAGCEVPGLEATLSDKGKITKVESAKSLGPRKK